MKPSTYASLAEVELRAEEKKREVAEAAARKKAEAGATYIDERGDIQQGVDPNLEVVPARRQAPPMPSLQDLQSLNPYEFAIKYGNKALLDRQAKKDAESVRQFEAAKERTGEQLATDVPIDLAKGAYHLVGDTAQLVLNRAEAMATNPYGLRDLQQKIVDRLDPEAGNRMRRQGAEIDRIRQRYGMLGLDHLGRWVDSAAREGKSSVAQVNEDLVQEENDRDMAENRAQQGIRIHEGMNPTLAKTLRVGADLVDGFGNTVTNPTTLTDMGIEQVPTFGLGMGAKAAVTADAIAVRAAGIQERLLAKGLREGATDASRAALLESAPATRQALLAQAGDELARRNMMGLVTATEASSQFTGARDEALQESPEVIGMNNPEFDVEVGKLEKAGMDRKEAQQIVQGRMADAAGIRAAAITAPVALTSSRLTAGFETNPLAGAAGRTALHRIGDAAKDVGAEMLEEGIQGSWGQYALNEGIRAEVDPTRDVLHNVGIAGGQGAAAALGMAGGTKAPSLAKNVVQLPVSLAWQGVKARGERALAAQDAEVQAQRAEARTQFAEAAVNVAANAPEVHSNIPAPSEAEASLVPEKLRATVTSADRVVGLAQAVEALETQREHMSPQEQLGLALYVAKTASTLRQHLNTVVAPEVERLNSVDPEQQAPVVEYSEQIHRLLESELVRDIETQVPASFSEEQLGEMYAQIPDAPLDENAPVSPDVVRAIEATKQLASTAPDLVTREAAQRVLAHSKNLTPGEKTSLQLAEGLAKVRETYQSTLQQLENDYTSFKSSDVVRNEIRSAGFQQGNSKLKSVGQHVRGITQALAAGNTAEAQTLLTQFQRFAEHMGQKAVAFDTAAKQQLELGTPTRKTQQNLSFKTIGADGQLTDAKTGWVNLAAEGSRANIDAIHADAGVTVQAYNLLAQQMGVPTLQEVSAPSWKSYTPTPKAEASNAATATVPADAPAPRAGDATSEPVVSDAPAADEAVEPTRAEPAPSAAPTETVEQRAGEDARDQPVARTGTLEDALALSEDDYIAAVNPSSKVTDAEELQAFEEVGLDRRDVPSDVEDLGTRTDRQGNTVRLVRAGNGDLFVLDEKGDPLAQMVDAGGNQQMSYVVPEARGRGLGVMVAKQRIIDAPFAQSGGFSPAGEAARRAAFRELQAERNPKAPQTVAERFPGLVATQITVTEETPAEIRLGAQNRLLTAFRLNQKAQGLFARLPNAIDALKTALESGADGLRQLYTKDQQHLTWSADQLRGLNALVNTGIPKIVDRLNSNLQNAAVGRDRDGKPRKSGDGKTAKGFLENLLKGKLVWWFDDKQSLHATSWSNKGISYQPEIAQAMALAGANWALANMDVPPTFNREKLLAMYGDAWNPQLEEAYRTSHYYEALVRSLAGDIQKILGLSADPNAPQNYSEGVMYALAQDTVVALADMGVLQLNEVPTGTDRKVVTFIKWQREDGKGWTKLKSLMGGKQLLQRLLYPDAADLPSFGTAPTNVPTRVDGQNIELSDVQRTAIENRQKNPNFRNGHLATLLTGFGLDNVRTLLGWQDVDLKSLAPGHARAVAGINQGIQYALESMDELDTLWQQKAAADGKSADEIPVHYGYRIISNGRMMQNGFGPQSNKYARELIGPRATLDLVDNDTHITLFHLALAQALGLKTEQITNIEAVNQVGALLAEDGPYAGVVKNLREMLATGNSELANRITDEVMALREDGEMEPTFRAFHALVTWARFQNALEAGTANEFENFLAFELDGKTDGPINAMMHFGIWKWDQQTIDVLRQGGIFVNETEKTTLGAWGKAIGDLYQNSATRMSDWVRGAWSTLKPWQAKKLHAALRLMELGGLVDTGEDNGVSISDVKAKRAIAKGPVMTKSYGSGDNTIIGKMAYDIVDKLYAEMSKALIEDRPLDPKIVRAVKELVPSVNLSNHRAFAKFEFSAAQMAELQKNLLFNGGKAVTAAVDVDMAPVLSTFQMLYKASALQTFAYAKAYQAKVEARKAELIAAGKMTKYDVLPKAEEEKIGRQLASIAPTYKLGHSTGDNQGVSVLETDRRGKQLGEDGRPVSVQGITGGSLSLDVRNRQILMPGVRAAALLTIAAGDSNMMTRFAAENPADTTDVYDGLEVVSGDLKSIAKRINDITAEGWSQDVLGAVAASFASLDLDVDSLSAEEVAMLAEALRLGDGANVEHIKATVAELQKELPARAAEIKAIKDVMLKDMAFASDHMSGGEAPHVNGKPRVEDPVRYMAEKLAGAQNNQLDETTPLGERIKSQLNTDGIASLDQVDVRLVLETFPFASKVTQFVYNQIEHLLPANLQVFIGSEQALARKQAELFPGVQFNNHGSNGQHYQGAVFLSATSEEVLVHELVHAATYQLMLDYFAGKVKGMTAAQKEAIGNLRTLAEEFISLPALTESMETAQQVVQDWFNEGAVAEAVNEFMAWSLTNPDVQNQLAQTPASSKLKALAKRVVDFVRKALGLPKNGTVDSFLNQALGEFHRMARRPARNLSPASGRVLEHTLPGHQNDAEQRRLEYWQEKFQQVRSRIPRNGGGEVQTALNAAGAVLQANEITEAFIAAGFQFNPQQEATFRNIQATLASTIQLDPATLTAFQSLYDEAMKVLEVKDFLTSPVNNGPVEMAAAKARFDALKGDKTLRLDPLKRSNLLANFVALGLVDPQFRGRLESISVARPTVSAKNLDEAIRNYTTRAFDWIADTAVSTTTGTQRQAIDTLAERLVTAQDAMLRRQEQGPTLVQQANAMLRTGMIRLDAKIGEWDNKRTASTKLADRLVDGLVVSTRAMLSGEQAKAFGEGLISMANGPKVWAEVRDLISELVGTQDSNRALNVLLNQAKHMVSRTRQRLRDEGPAEVRALFSKELSKETWELLHTAIGKADMQVLLGDYTAEQIVEMLQDSSKLEDAISALEGQLDSRYADRWMAHARDLGAYLVTGRATGESNMLYSNADAIARQLGQKQEVKPAVAEANARTIDQIVTLEAMKHFTSEQNTELAKLFEGEKEGMKKLLMLMGSLVAEEKGKPAAQRQQMNRWKGYVPTQIDPRHDLVLATPAHGAKLLRMGYTRIGGYSGDSLDPVNQLSFYRSTDKVLGLTVGAGGRATYNQGATQTVEATVAGVDRLTGQTLDPAVQTVIRDEATVARIAARMKQQGARGAHGLRPVFNAAGEIEAFERLIDPAMLNTHLRTKKDLANSVGMWMGRQMEEQIAQQVNAEVVKVAKAMWDEARKRGRDGEFVNMLAPGDEVMAEAWDAVPYETQLALMDAFDGPVMVRRDSVNNMFGYRSASIADVFTGASRLPQGLRDNLMKAALGTLGPSAYQRLVLAERSWQGLVGIAKDAIVVKSGIVGLANAFANQLQLLSMGVPLTKLFQTQARKVQETETYLRAEKEIAQINVRLAAATKKSERTALERRAQVLRDQISNLSISPLIEAGELPSIAEGLSEQDDYSILADGVKWMDNQVEKLPKGVSTAVKYALITKDTALYQGLSRMIQFGDFMAKATLYDHLLTTKNQETGELFTHEEALSRVNDSFVNYNLLAGRTRGYLDSMGLQWFWTYKLRIQKIVLRTIRENPLQFLMSSAAAPFLGADSLLSSSAPVTNWGYSLGPGQVIRAHNTILWSQLFD